VDFFDMKGVVVELCRVFGVATHMMPMPSEPRYLVHGRAAQIIGRPARPSSATFTGAHLGTIGQLSPALAKDRGWPGDDAIYVAELDLKPLLSLGGALESISVVPLPRFPSIVRDISILVDEALPAETVRGTIRSAAPAHLLESVREFDRYQGKGVPAGSVSLSLRLTFRAADRTLTDAEVQAAMDAVLGALGERHGAVQR
jgi:phenylalanyl-tRNA synthetase beta chain